MHSSLLVMELVIQFLIRRAPVLDGPMPGLVMMQFVLQQRRGRRVRLLLKHSKEKTF